MKFSELPWFSPKVLQFSCEGTGGGWKSGELVQIFIDNDGYLIRQHDHVCWGKVLYENDETRLQVLRNQCIWRLLDVRSNTLLVQGMELRSMVDIERLHIVVDDSIIERLNEAGELFGVSREEVLRRLEEIFVGHDPSPGKQVGQLIVGCYERDNDVSFEIFGSDWIGVVKHDNGIHKLTKIRRSRELNNPLSMLLGDVSFMDGTVASLLSYGSQNALLLEALSRSGSYLKLWKNYSELEWKYAFDRVAKVGSVRYKDAILNTEETWEWKLSVDDSELQVFRKRWKEMGLTENTLVDVSERKPDLSDKLYGDTSFRSPREELFRGKIRFSDSGLTLMPINDHTDATPPRMGYVFCSLAGDQTVQMRRWRALEAINRKERFPQLHYLLEGMPVPVVRQSKKECMSASVRECFSGVPNQAQRRALDVAINTPDIAIIVGPPGTGKTQVIAALQRRLTELNESSTLRHSILVSSYQHDAVDNALSRSNVLGLPPTRVGIRSSNDDGQVDSADMWREKKRTEVAARLEELRRENPLSSVVDELNLNIVKLKIGNGAFPERLRRQELVGKLLETLIEQGVRFSDTTIFEWDEYVSEQKEIEKRRLVDPATGLARFVRGIRTNPVSYSDDGVERILDLNRELERNFIRILDHERELLRRLAGGACPGRRDLEMLSAFRNTMLDRIVRVYSPSAIVLKADPKEISLLGKIESELYELLKRTDYGVLQALESFQLGLACSPQEANSTIRSYASIVGATCQQSAGKQMSALKAVSSMDHREDIEFDTVIIDEAARANPLDLLVPMSMARKRIILVGDHRQLPHLIQRELEDELVTKECLSAEQAKAYEQSLFERLYKQLRKMEEEDGIQRVVMLDTQYRMHPVLGNFISSQFYECEGDGPVMSGRVAEEFSHDVPGYRGRCAAWMNVSLEQGKERRDGNSRTRKAEADAIAAEVKRIVDVCGSSLSIGVVTFYSAQVKMIMRSMLTHGITNSENGEIVISEKYRRTKAGQEWIRVGTVDSFQGKEFDIVFLSIVRANDFNVPEVGEEADVDTALTRKFGHLRLPNRMNVAMSRQKKLLVVVGCRSMIEAPGLGNGVSALTAFLKLCDDGGHNVQ